MKNINKNLRRLKKKSNITFKDTIYLKGVLLLIQNRNEWGSYLPILFRIHDQLSNMLTRHCKVFCVRFDFHVNPNVWTEGQFSEFLAVSLRKVNSKYKGNHKIQKIAYVWVREHGADGLHHYHIMLAVNGNSTNYPNGIATIMWEEWQKLGHKSWHRSDSKMIKNTVDDNFKAAFKHFSYLAKIFTKDEQPVNARNYGSSQVKSNQKIFNKLAA